MEVLGWQSAYGHCGRVFDLAVSSDSSLLVSASEDTTARIWQIQNLRQASLLVGHTAEVLRVSWKPHSHIIATGAVLCAPV